MDNKKRVAVNIDRDFLGYIYRSVGKNAECADEKVKMYLAPYLESDVSDIIVNIFAMTSLYPSKIMTWTGAVADRKFENGIAVDYSDGFAERATKEMYNAAKRDPIEIILTETKNAGKRAWVSIRMNDVHGNLLETSKMRGDMYYEVKKRGMFLDERISGEFYKSCVDYSHEYVRNLMLDYIAEAIERYDFDVFELDFTREIFCVNYIENPNCHEIMTEFVRSVYLMLKRKNKDMRLAVRLCRDYDDALVFGLDVREWIRLGIVDVLIPSPRFRSTDSDMPIDRWLQLACGTGVEVYAGVERFIHERILNSLESLKGFFAAYLDAGADMMYLFNYYREAAPCADMSAWTDKVGDTSSFVPYDELRGTDDYVMSVWRAAADVRVAKSGVRRNVMTFKEDSMTPRGERPYRPLPCKIDGKHTLTMQTGYITDERVRLILGVARGEGIARVTVDGKEAAPLGRTDKSFLNSIIIREGSTDLTELDLYAFDVTVGADRVRQIDVFADGITLGYVEFEITAK